jgi:hypothetical protein
LFIHHRSSKIKVGLLNSGRQNMRSFTKGTSLRTALLVSASVMSLAVASPEVWAADMPTKAAFRAAPIEPTPLWTWYLEGGGFETSGRTLFDDRATHARFGWEGAVGLDYRIAGTPWHISGQFRYGKAGDRNTPTSGFFTAPGIGYYGAGYTVNGTLNHKESHAVADFAVGHDIGIGAGQAQVKFGVRVVDLSAKSTVSGTLYAGYPIYGSYAGVITFKSRFVGAGPRGSIEGSHPIMGPLSVDYMGGVAYLYGTRSFNIEASAAGLGSGAFGVSDVAGIFNADASLGLSYAFSKAAKLTAGYRFDGYWGAMKMFDISGNVVNNDRFYYGPFLRLTGAF